MTHNDPVSSDWFPVILGGSIVLASLIIAFGFGPNCAPKTLTIVTEDDPPPTESDVDTSGDLPPPEGPDLASCRQWSHTRLEDCKAQKGEFMRCMWWVFGGDHPDDYDVEPHRWDGAHGYGAALQSE